LLEARKVGQQVTGRSTAKITTQHALIYAHLIRYLGVTRAQAYADANRAGMARILALAVDLRIDCNLERKPAYAYTQRESRRRSLEVEARAARKLGLVADVVDRAPLPFDTAGALRFPDQAQFNPARYGVGLAASAAAHGARIFENTRVTGLRKGPAGVRWRVEAGRHRLDADHVILATNLPIGGPVAYDQCTQPRCHYAMALRAKSPTLIDGMFIDVDRPAHSLRMGADGDGPLLVALGPRFETGHDGDVAARFRDLEAWVRQRFDVGPVAWRWVNEDYDSPDRVAFAGELAKKAPGLYVGTGFNAWGISNGTAAAMLVADQIDGRESPFAALYDPERRAPKDFNAGGDTRSRVRDVAAIAPGEGGVVKRGKQSIAVWKSAEGRLHTLDASCTHKGCTVTWNNADRTWDCPCHGSMFSADGAVIHGPATEPLKRVRLPAAK
jgi:glycine/D-amino acid oxidase-like deaminating enzyme/nitrite reductase/ring-hydroxylating ferredoxin subunit